MYDYGSVRVFYVYMRVLAFDYGGGFVSLYLYIIPIRRYLDNGGIIELSFCYLLVVKVKIIITIR